MGDIIRRGGQIVRAANGLITRNPDCCCGTGEDCCGGDVPTDYPTLYLHLTNVSDCACLDGICIELTYDPLDGFWSGVGPGGGGCDATNAIWRFACIDNPDAGDDLCLNFRLSLMDAGVVCNAYSAFPDSCNCPPDPSWTYTIILSGIGCCNTDPGTVTAVVDDVPC